MYRALITWYSSHPATLLPFWYIITTPGLTMGITVPGHSAPFHCSFCKGKIPASVGRELFWRYYGRMGGLWFKAEPELEVV
jgi:hypothetical protein